MNYVFLTIGFIALIGIPVAATIAVPRQDLSRILGRYVLAVVLLALGLFEIASGMLFVEGVFAVHDYSSKFVLGAISIFGVLGGVIFIIGGLRAISWRPQSSTQVDIS